MTYNQPLPPTSQALFFSEPSIIITIPRSDYSWTRVCLHLCAYLVLVALGYAMMAWTTSSCEDTTTSHFGATLLKQGKGLDWKKRKVNIPAPRVEGGGDVVFRLKRSKLTLAWSSGTRTVASAVAMNRKTGVRSLIVEEVLGVWNCWLVSARYEGWTEWESRSKLIFTEWGNLLLWYYDARMSAFCASWVHCPVFGLVGLPDDPKCSFNSIRREAILVGFSSPFLSIVQ